jgi:membrane protein DedA with SNARE-associated domain
MKKIRIVSILLLIALIIPNIDAYSQTNQTTDSVSNVNKKSKIEQVTSWYMDNMNYGTITLLMTIESTFIPFPSEVVVPPAAYKASQEDSNLNIFLVVVFATIGAIIGALVNYYLALWLGRPIVHKFAESKFGKLCLLSSEIITKAEDYFVKHGRSSTFVGRLVPGIRQLISIPAGLAKMPLLPFVIFTTLGAGIWNMILAFLGYLAHGQADLIDKYSSELSYILLGLGVLFIIYLVYSNFVKKKKASNQTSNNED